MPEMTDDAAFTGDPTETTAEEAFAEDPADNDIVAVAVDPTEEAAPVEQSAPQGDSAAQDGSKAPEVAADAQAAVSAAPAVDTDAEFGPKLMPAPGQPDPLVETQEHPDHPSRHHVAARPCPAGPQ